MSSFRLRRAWRALGLVLIIAACREPRFNGTAIEPPETAAEIDLRDSSGNRFRLSDQRGAVTLVFFGYTHCPDVCPATLADWRKVAVALGDDVQRVRFVFISVDPERDHPAALQRYAARFSPHIRGLTGSRPAIDSLLGRWHLGAFRSSAPTDTLSYLVGHPSQVFVVDREGRVRLTQSGGMTTSQIADDIRALL
jgi:protein SCO1